LNEPETVKIKATTVIDNEAEKELELDQEPVSVEV
jgi:hypothetical protein